MGKRTRLPVVFRRRHGQEYLPMPPHFVPYTTLGGMGTRTRLPVVLGPRHGQDYLPMPPVYSSITFTSAPSPSAGSFSARTISPCAAASVNRSAEPFHGNGLISNSFAVRSSRTG
jgi:hypothetical protein